MVDQKEKKLTVYWSNSGLVGMCGPRMTKSPTPSCISFLQSCFPLFLLHCCCYSVTVLCTVSHARAMKPTQVSGSPRLVSHFLTHSMFTRLCSLTPFLLALAGHFREPLFHCSHLPPTDGPPTATNRTSVSISLALRTWRRTSPGCMCVGGVGLQIRSLTLT